MARAALLLLAFSVSAQAALGELAGHLSCYAPAAAHQGTACALAHSCSRHATPTTPTAPNARGRDLTRSTDPSQPHECAGTGSVFIGVSLTDTETLSTGRQQVVASDAAATADPRTSVHLLHASLQWQVVRPVPWRADRPLLSVLLI